MRAVRADVGVALLFKSSIREELENGSLRILPMPDLKISAPIYLVTRSRKFFSTFQSRLYDLLRASFRQAEPGRRVDAASSGAISPEPLTQKAPDRSGAFVVTDG
jgi:hypothetical protein